MGVSEWVFFLKFLCVGYLLVVTTQDKDFDYCKLTCKIGKRTYNHTICEYGCKTKEGVTPFQPDLTFRNRCLHYHNMLRSKVATGKFRSIGKAANMMALNYDPELEYVAGCWINFRGRMFEDKCRTTQKFNESVGQNLFTSNDDLNKEENLKAAFELWFDEYKKFDPQLIDDYGWKVNPASHFTQMIWAKTTHVGCAFCSHKPPRDKAKEYLLACNYGPGGNSKGEKIFKRGAPASKCPEDTTENENYTGLCGNISMGESKNDTGHALDPLGRCFLTIALPVLIQHMYSV